MEADAKVKSKKNGKKPVSEPVLENPRQYNY